MIDHLEIQLACRDRLNTLVVCTTGAIALSVTPDSYVREEGSFIEEGFEIGMELNAGGFEEADNNGVSAIEAVTDLEIKVDRTLVAEDSRETMGTLPWGAPWLWSGVQIDKVLTVGLPSLEVPNRDFTPATGRPYFDEQYVDGPAALKSMPLGRIQGEPMYMPRVNVPSNTGIRAAHKYKKAILELFPPGLVIVLPSGATVKVSGDPAPFGGQLLNGKPGFAGNLVTVPLHAQAYNSI